MEEGKLEALIPIPDYVKRRTKGTPRHAKDSMRRIDASIKDLRNQPGAAPERSSLRRLCEQIASEFDAPAKYPATRASLRNTTDAEEVD